MTIQDAIANIINVSYTNIRTKFTSPPAAIGKISTAQTPVMFARNVALERSNPSLNFKPGLVNAEVEFVVLVEPGRQNLQVKNYELLRNIMQEFVSLWELNSTDLKIISYNIREGEETVGDTSYFAVLALVQIGL